MTLIITKKNGKVKHLAYVPYTQKKFKKDLKMTDEGIQRQFRRLLDLFPEKKKKKTVTYVNSPNAA